MLDYKRKQEEELTKRMLEERNREKAEDRAARERIKQQIALVSNKFIFNASLSCNCVSMHSGFGLLPGHVHKNSRL